MSKQDKVDLLRWNTPFTDKQFPAVSMIPHQDGPVTVVVAPHGIDTYPKYLVRFSGVAAYRCVDESVAPVSAFNALNCEAHNLSAYLWLGSPWLHELEELAAVVEFEYGTLKHYVILGANTIAELLAAEDPVIEEIDAPTRVATFDV